MSLALQTEKVVMANFSDDKIQLLKNTVCKGSTNDELELFMHVCSRTGLDPFRNQIYAIKRAGKMTIQTGIDGFRLIAERTDRYSPGRETTYGYDQQGKIISATAYVKKQTLDGTWHEVSSTAFYDEYVQKYNGKPSQFWEKMPHAMLSKCAESLALRKAFPANFSGIYTTEEMGQAQNHEVQAEIIQEPIQESIKEEMPDLKPEEIFIYIDKNWSPNQTLFKQFMDEMMKNKGWNARKCVETFQKHKEHTTKTFDGWMMNKAGI